MVEKKPSRALTEYGTGELQYGHVWVSGYSKKAPCELAGALLMGKALPFDIVWIGVRTFMLQGLTVWQRVNRRAQA